jgi:hypothetical protein
MVAGSRGESVSGLFLFLVKGRSGFKGRGS